MRSALLAVLIVALASAPGVADDAGVPEENRADLHDPPPRPSVDDAQEPARRLFDAIVRNRPELAEGFFFPRAAFLKVKAMQKPERYYDRLHQRFVADIRALHRVVREAGSEPTFERLELTRRGGWVRPGEEGNRLPYWASRYARLHYRAGGVARTLEVRVLISWGKRWYVIHLSDFRT